MRDRSIDIVSSIFIIQMVLFHIGQQAGLLDAAYYEVSIKVFACFMPWFFFKSGIFFKPQSNKETVIKEAKRALVPFVVFSLIGHICYIFVLYSKHDTNIIHYTLSPIKQLLQGGSIAGNMPLWFLSSFFAVKVLFNAIYSWHKQFLLVLIAAIPYLLYITHTELPIYYIANISAGIFFYGCGFYLKDVLDKWYVILPCIVAFTLSLFIIPTYVDMRTNQVVLGNFYLWYPLAIAGIITFKYIFSIIDFGLSTILGVVSRNSIFILCTHWIIIMLVSLILPNLTGWELFTADVVALLVLIPILLYLSNSVKSKILEISL